MSASKLTSLKSIDVKLSCSNTDSDLNEVLQDVAMRMNRINQLEHFSAQQCHDDLECINNYHSSWSRSLLAVDRIGQELTSFGVAELFLRIWNKWFEKKSSQCEPEMSRSRMFILFILWNYTDKCQVLCERIYQRSIYVNILSYLESMDLDPGKTAQQNYRQVISGFMEILHNMVQKVLESREAMRERKAVDIFQRYRGAPDLLIACKSLILQGYVITEKENEVINSDDKVFAFMKEILEDSLEMSDHLSKYGLRAIEVIKALNRLAANDNNQKRIVKSGMLSFYVKLLQPDCSEEEQAASAEGLWILAFKCREEVESEPGCVEALQKLASTSSSEVVSSMAKGAMWKIEEPRRRKATLQRSAQIQRTVSASGRSDHVFISYQWDNKPVILKLAEELKNAGYNVWVDADNMCGSVLESIAEAVENAAVVIVCLSQKYKESPSCRTEVEYTFRLRKKVFPLRLQPRYYPDGWLGVLAGSQLVHDFSSSEKYNSSIKALIRDLGVQGRAEVVDCLDGPIVSVEVGTSITQSQNTNNRLQSTEDVQLWLSENKLGHLREWFRDFDGSLLMELKEMRRDAPETFYRLLKDSNFSAKDILSVNKALKQL